MAGTTSLGWWVLVLGQVAAGDDGIVLPPQDEPAATAEATLGNSEFAPFDAQPSLVQPAAVAPAEFSAEPQTGIVPAEGAAPLVAMPPSGAKPAAVLLRTAFNFASPTPLHGESLTLQQALKAAQGRGSSQSVVAGYWKLSLAIAEYHFAADEAAYLNGLPVPGLPQHEKMLNAAIAAAKARETDAHTAAIEAQFELAEITGRGESVALPLAGDLPLTGRYLTHFETLRRRGAVSPGLHRIHVLLPILHESIDAHAAAVIAATEARDATQAGYANGEVAVDSMLALQDHVQQHRRRFLAAVGRYNQHVADYALAVARADQSAERIAAMLIASPTAERSVLVNRDSSTGIRRVSGEEEFRRPSLAPTEQ